MAAGEKHGRIARLATASGLLMLLAVPPAHATTITVVNLDGPGEGFNDPTARAPEGGNPGLTLGGLRLNAFHEAADRWALIVDSSVEIEVEGNFDPMFCNGVWALLGFAGPNTVHWDFSGAPVANTVFAQATANSIAGVDLAPGFADIGATFNSDIDNACLGGVSGWYYGFDGNPGAGQIDLIQTLLHEMAHGLGFLTFVDLDTGAKFLGRNDTFMLNLEDHSTGLHYPAMSDAERVTASIDTGDLHWTGANVRAASILLSAGKTGDHVHMYAPNPNESGSSVSHFDTTLTPDELMEPFFTPTTIQDLTKALMKDIGWSLLGPAPTPTVTPIPTPRLTCTPGLPVSTPTPLSAGGVKCQRALSKEATKFVKAKTKALQKCHERLLKDKFEPPSGPGDPGPGGGARLAFCLTESKTIVKIDKASSKIVAKIAKACGGDDKTCGTADPGEESPDTLGYYGTCPNFEGSATPECSATITDCDDIAACVECIGEAAVDQALLLYYDQLIDTDPVAQKALNKCQLTIGKETSKFLLAKEKNLGKCWDAALKQKHQDACPNAAAPLGSVARKTAKKIAKAESKKIAKICKACGGGDKDCDQQVTPVNPLTPVLGGTLTGDDFTPAQIGFPADCNDVKVPGGGPFCDVNVGTLADLIYCVDCVTEFKVDCIDAARMPELQGRVYPCECNP